MNNTRFREPWFVRFFLMLQEKIGRRNNTRRIVLELLQFQPLFFRHPRLTNPPLKLLLIHSCPLQTNNSSLLHCCTSMASRDRNFLSNRRSQSKSFSQTCCLTSAGPFTPRRFAGFTWRHYSLIKRINNTLLMKSAASTVQPGGRSVFFNWICLAMILFLISRRSFPRYGLYWMKIVNYVA